MGRCPPRSWECLGFLGFGHEVAEKFHVETPKRIKMSSYSLVMLCTGDEKCGVVEGSL